MVQSVIPKGQKHVFITMVHIHVRINALMDSSYTMENVSLRDAIRPVLYRQILPIQPPCNGKGKCVLKDLAKLDRADEADYVCSCFPIYRGDLCDTCNLENSVESEADKGKCNPRSCQDSDGLVCSGKESASWTLATTSLTIATSAYAMLDIRVLATLASRQLV